MPIKRTTAAIRCPVASALKIGENPTWLIIALNLLICTIRITAKRIYKERKITSKILTIESWLREEVIIDWKKSLNCILFSY